ncbi:MAG: hypothetical protein ABGW87_14220, partial [Sphingomonadaceae bacterium]
MSPLLLAALTQSIVPVATPSESGGDPCTTFESAPTSQAEALPMSIAELAEIADIGSPVPGSSPALGISPDSKRIARTTYGDLGLGEHAARASRGAYGADSLCHHDPMFTSDRRCIFGQVGAAQTHLANHGVGRGDVFVFFGRFDGEGHGAHHRIF